MRRRWLSSSILSFIVATSAVGQTPSGSPATTTGAAAAPVSAPEPDAVDALKRMSAFLQSLKTFDLTANSSLDLVTKNKQRVQLDAVVHYKVKKPGIWMDLVSDIRSRRYFYDGKQFTIYAPKLNYYAFAPAPPTNGEFLKALEEKRGISLPLADLFRWNDGDDSDLKALTSGFSVGTATLDGVATDHWAFRQGNYDWEVWIEKGDRPVPRKLVIIDRSQLTYPTYTARLQWILNPAFTDDEFTFKPDKDAKRIHLAEFEGDAK